MKARIEHWIQKQVDPVLYRQGRRAGRLGEIHFSLDCLARNLVLNCHIQGTSVRARVLRAAQDDFETIVLQTLLSGQAEIFEIRPLLETIVSNPLHETRCDLQTSVEKLISRHFAGTRILSSTVASDLEHSLSAKYVRVQFRSGGSRSLAIAVGPQESQSSIDGVLSNGLLWRDLLREQSLEGSHNLLLLVPSQRLQVLKSRLGWIRGAGRDLRLMAMDSEMETLSPIDLRDCGNLDTALTRVKTASNITADDRTRRVVALEPRWGAAGPRTERQLESLILQDICVIDARLDPRFVYPQVPAFLAGDRGMIDILSITREGRLAILELKVSEDIELPMQSLDYWLRVRWHHSRNEFQARGYFPGVTLSPLPPLLFVVCPQFCYHSSFPRLIRQMDTSVPLVQVGINEDWRQGVRVVLRRAPILPVA